MEPVEIMRHFFEDVWNKGDMTAADDCFAGPHVTHDPDHAWVTRGAEGMKRLVSLYRAAFPDLRISVEDCLEAGDRVVTRWVLRGKNTERWFGHAPTGRAVEVSGIQIDRFEDGKSTETWMQWDMLGMLIGLGHASESLREQGSEEADISFGATHKMWWQRDEQGRDEPHPGPEE